MYFWSYKLTKRFQYQTTIIDVNYLRAALHNTKRFQYQITIIDVDSLKKSHVIE